MCHTCRHILAVDRARLMEISRHLLGGGFVGGVGMSVTSSLGIAALYDRLSRREYVVYHRALYHLLVLHVLREEKPAAVFYG